MLTAEQSLQFILSRVDLLGRGTRAHERAAHRVLIDLTQRWAAPTDQYIDDSLAEPIGQDPTDQYIDDSLEMAEPIGQDLADITRHMTDLQHHYLKALFETEKA